MRSRPSTDSLDLAELLRVDPLARAEVVHLADPSRRVHQVVLAETFKRLQLTAPHSVVVLHAEAAAGGWSLAAALHAAWERNASAVVVPRAAMSSSSAVLAERLGTALLMIEDDPVDVALALAGQISAPRSARAVRVALCAERLADQSSIRGVLGVLNAELGRIPVALTIGGSVVAGRAAAVLERPDHEQVRVLVHGAGERAWAELVASIPATAPVSAPAATADLTAHVGTLLRLARLPLLAVWAQTRMNTATQVAQEQAAFRLLRRSSGEPSGDRAVPLQLGGAESASWSSELGWRVEGINRAVWIAPARDTGEAPSPELTQLVRAAWQRHLPDWPIVADDDGWLSWQNSADGDRDSGTDGEGDSGDAEGAMRRGITTMMPTARRHALVLGIGSVHPGVPGLMRSVVEARLAAYAAREGGAGSVTWFDQVGVRATLAWLPIGRIAQVADLRLTELMAARDRSALVETVLAVLDCGGSLSQASTRLGVHRNTVLSRVARAKELGLVLDDPAQRLALHVLTYALDALWREPDAERAR
jgi:hypothetical protein